MAKTLAPTKGNLMMAKNTLRLSKQGYEMLDKKRNILIREMMLLIEEAKEVEAKIEETFAAAYKALESANVIMGVSKVQNLAHSAVLENSVKVDLRSVMGVEIPVVTADKPDGRPVYGFNGTSSALDEASVKFNEVKVMTVKLTEIENAVYRLAMNIKKTAAGLQLLLIGFQLSKGNRTVGAHPVRRVVRLTRDRKSTRLNSSH